MSSRVAVGLAVMLVLVPALGAQQPAASNPEVRLTALAARLDSLQRGFDSADVARRLASRPERKAHVTRAGRIVLVHWETVSSNRAQRITSRADSIVSEFGGISPAYLDAVVFVQDGTEFPDSVRASLGLSRRTPRGLDWRSSDTMQVAERLAASIGSGYRMTLDSVWRAWLPNDFGMVWIAKQQEEWALRSLTEPYFELGHGCLAGRLAACRLWLGIDSDSEPLAVRYTPTDLRRRVESQFPTRVPDRSSCLSGNDAACMRLAGVPGMLDRVPAPHEARASLIRAVWARHGAAAIGAALADRRGSVGERLMRAAGVSEDSLVLEWRAWTLARGRPDRLAASVPQALSVLFAALLVVFAASRSGRWR
jgi:hypothetical protein